MARTPLSVERVPLPSLSPPFQTADAFRFMMFSLATVPRDSANPTGEELTTRGRFAIDSRSLPRPRQQEQQGISVAAGSSVSIRALGGIRGKQTLAVSLYQIAALHS